MTDRRSSRTPSPPDVMVHELLDRDDRPLKIRGRLIGLATTEGPHHTHPESYDLRDQLTARQREMDAQYLEDNVVSSATGEARRLLDEYLEDLRDEPDEDTEEDLIDRYGLRDRCPACRWFEVRIFDVEAEITPTNEFIAGQQVEQFNSPQARYLLLTYGPSTIPWEITRRRATWTDSGFGLIEALTQRRSGSRRFLPAASSDALRHAAMFDDEIADAFENREVA